MAKIKGYQQAVDYTSQIGVSAHSGIAKAAQSERQIAENWASLGADLNTMIVKELKTRNIEDAQDLASQISYDKKPVDVEIDGKTETVNMTHVIQPEGKIVGESGLLAYKKMLATNWIAQLDNDLTRITETQANESEDVFETMEMFAAKTSQKHDVIYEQLPDSISNMLRVDAEKHIITRGARVQNVFLGEKNRRDNELWDNQLTELSDKIWNTAERGGDVTKHLENLADLYDNGIELKNIKGASSANKRKAMENNAGLVSFFKLTNTLTTKDFSDPMILSFDIKNTQAIISLLNPIPSKDSYNVYDMTNKLGTTLTKQQVHDTIKDPVMRTKMLAHFNRRLAYLKELSKGQDDIITGMNLTNEVNSRRDRGLQNRNFTKKEWELMNPNQNKDWIRRYNEITGKSLDINNAAGDPNYQIYLATDRQVIDPNTKSFIENNFKNFDVSAIKEFYDKGYFSSLKNYTHKGDKENALVAIFGNDLGQKMTVFTEIVESGVASIEDLGRIYSNIQEKEARGTLKTEKEIAIELGAKDENDLRKRINAIYESMTPGLGTKRTAGRYNFLIKQYRGDILTQTLLSTFDLKDWIYDEEESINAQYRLVQDGYIHNPSNLKARDSIDRESYILYNQSAQKLMLPNFNRETKQWEYKGDWNLDYAIPIINMMISQDPRFGKGHYEQFWTSDKPHPLGTFAQGRLTVQEFVDEEFRSMGRVKLVPTGPAQEYPEFYVGKVNDDGSIDYIENADGSKAILDLAKYYIPAHRNLVSGNPGFKKYLVDMGMIKHDGTPVNRQQEDLDSWSYWAGREWLQFKHGLSDIMPDPWQTTGETLGAGTLGAVSPGAYSITGGIKDTLKAGAGWLVSKTGIEWKPSTNAIRKLTVGMGRITKSKSRLALLAALGMTLYTFTTANSRYITNALEGRNLWEEEHDMPYLGYYREPGMFDLPQYILDAYDKNIPEYVHTEEYITPSGFSYPKGTKSTVLLGAEQHPEKGWIVFPHVVVINGERVLLNTEEAIKYAIEEGGYTPFENGNAAQNMAENFSDTVRFWRTNPNTNWWLDGINPGNPNE
tara:strand:+ start:2373 stop:5555 length:3183 start_codon:yes stop_codon:yes gene_type:complete